MEERLTRGSISQSLPYCSEEAISRRHAAFRLRLVAEALVVVLLEVAGVSGTTTSSGRLKSTGTAC